MGQHKTGRFLISTSECNYCSETNQYFYVFHADGSVTIDYEGCGGYQGRNAKCNGESVGRDDALRKLEQRLHELRSKDEELHKEIQSFEEYLDQHRKPKFIALERYDLEDLEAETLKRKVQTQEGVDELAAAGWQWREIDTFTNGTSGIRQTGYWAYMFAPDIDLTPLNDLVVIQLGGYGEPESESQNKFSEWEKSLPKNKVVMLYWHSV